MVNTMSLVGFWFLAAVSGQLLRNFRRHDDLDLASLVDGLSSFSSKPAALILTAASHLCGPYDSLLAGRNVHVLLVGDTVKDEWPLHAHVYLLVVESRDEAEMVVKNLLARVIWASYYELLVLVPDVTSREAMVVALHRKQFPNVVLVTDRQVTVVYSPYQFKAASPAVETVVDVGFTRLREDLANRPRMPFTMVMSTMPIQPMVYTRRSKIRGYDGLLLESAARRLGARARLVQSADGILLGARLPNGSFRGSAGDLAKGRCDIGANCRYVQPQWRDTIDYTYPQTQDDYCLVVPKAARLPPLLLATLAFEWNIWVALTLTLALSWAVWCLIGKHVGAQRAALDVYRLVVTGSLGSKVSSIPKRCFVFTHVALSIVLTALYGGILVSFYTSPAYLPDINSLEMVDSAVSVIYSFGPLIDVITGVDEGDVMQRLNRKFQPVLTSYDWSLVVSRIADGEPEAVLMDHNFARFSVRNPSLMGKDGRPLLHEVRECALSPAFLGFALRRNSPLLAPLDALLLRMASAGLQGHYEAATDHDLSLAGLVALPQRSRRAADPLRLPHLAAPGLVLALGLALAGGCFACELLTFRIKHDNRHQSHQKCPGRHFFGVRKF